MNYRHAFHAGNFADVFKHVLLIRMLTHLRRKETPFRAIDTHAGIGLYDLSADAAERTQEWRDGIGRLEQPFGTTVEELIAPYRRVVEEVRSGHPDRYPGSPAVIRALLRPQDQAILVELHPADGEVLEQRFRGSRNIKVLHLDGWTALHALIPPKERRGVVLIDPPYEQRGELERLGLELTKAMRKWPTGIYVGWYPIKNPAEIEDVAAIFAAAASKGLRLELMVDRPDKTTELNGCGLFVLNPPWTLQREAEIILPALAKRLARSSYAAFRCEPFGTKEKSASAN